MWEAHSPLKSQCASSPEVDASLAANVVFLGESLSKKLALVQRYAVERGPSRLRKLQPNAMGTVERVERAISGACVSVAGQRLVCTPRMGP